MKVHLLHETRDFDFSAPLPANHDDLMRDLEVSTLLGAMAHDDTFLFDVSDHVLFSGLDDPAAIRYRQEILADCIANPYVIRAIYDLALGALDDKRKAWWVSSRLPTSILSGAVRQLEAFVARLKDLRAIAAENLDEFHSTGMTRLLGTLLSELDDDYFATIAKHLAQLRFRHGTLISATLTSDNRGAHLVLRTPGDTTTTWRNRIGLGRHSAYSFTIAPRDDAGADALAELTNRGVNLVANATAQSADHISDFFFALSRELGFYVACVNLCRDLAARGVTPNFPDPADPEPCTLAATALRDVSLVLHSPDPVVGNDVAPTHVPLVVVTGANSGGKSTFLRSAGLAQLMCQAGMFVAADHYRSSLVTGIFTHFIRDEDPSMTSGRLDDELRRLSRIADSVGPGGLVLLNESLGSTTEREGSEIARQVIHAFVDAGVRVVVVTHQFELSNGLRLGPVAPTLFLRAPRDDNGRRSFHLVEAEPLATSHGEDLFQKLGGWSNTTGSVA